MIDKKHFKTHIKNLRIKIDDFSNLIYTTFGMKNKNIFIQSNNTTPRNETTSADTNIIYPIISSNYNSHNNKIKSNTQQNFFQPKKSRNIYDNKNILKDSKKILNSLQNTLIKIKDKKREERLNELFHKTFIISNKYKKKNNKTVPKFIPNETKLLIPNNTNNKNNINFKELRFKIHHTIKMNTLPLCNSYMNKAHLFNEKLLEYYRSENHINLLKNFKKKFRYNMNIENHPKVKMYTDIAELEKMSGNNKVDFKKVFTPEEQKLIMLDTAYYFQRDSPNIFTNVNISKKKNLADRIQDEDEEHQIKKILSELLNKKNRNKLKKLRMGVWGSSMFRGIGDNAIAKIMKIVSSQEMKNLNVKKLENLDLNDFNTNNDEDDNNENSKVQSKKNFNFVKLYKINSKDADKQAENLRKNDIDKSNRMTQFHLNIESKLKSFEREINMISKDKALQKRAKDKMYYDKSKDEKNEFNIFTKQMQVEQNYEYLSKHRRKMRDLNQKNFDNKKDELEDITKELNKNANNNALSENKDKKFINYYINKIKLNYKQQ